MSKGLTPKREKFCQEMAKLGNQRQAYKKAYNCKNMKNETIDNNAYMLMQNSEVRARLKELSEKTKTKNIADAQEIQEFLTKIMRGQEVEQVPMMSDDGLVIAEKTVTPKDRLKAGETLAKMTGCFDIKVKVENVPIIQDDI